MPKKARPAQAPSDVLAAIDVTIGVLLTARPCGLLDGFCAELAALPGSPPDWEAWPRATAYYRGWQKRLAAARLL